MNKDIIVSSVLDEIVALKLFQAALSMQKN
jgi:hypothetical protein